MRSAPPVLTIPLFAMFLLLVPACVKEVAEEGEACQNGGPDQLVGIIECLPELECCLPPEDVRRSGGGICVRVEKPQAHDVGHAGDGQCPADLFDTGGDTATAAASDR